MYKIFDKLLPKILLTKIMHNLKVRKIYHTQESCLRPLPMPHTKNNGLSINVFQVPEINGFLTAGRKKNGEVEDELDRSLEGMDHSDEQFDKGNEFCREFSSRNA